MKKVFCKSQCLEATRISRTTSADIRVRERLKSFDTLSFLLLCYCMLSNETPTSLFERFSFISEVSARKTRCEATFVSIFIHRTSVVNTSLIVSALNLWSKLPDDVRRNDSRGSFAASQCRATWV